MSDIYEALAAVMADVQAVAKKDRNNHQNFNFRGIDSVVNAVGPALRTHKVIVVPDVTSVEYADVQTSTGKPSTACRVEVTYLFYAQDGSVLPASVAGEAWDSGDKATPKAMSVAFRTALLQALALPTDEPDPDSHTYERAEPEPVDDQVMATVEDWIDAADDAGVEVDADKVRAYAVQSKAHADQSVETLKKRIAEAAA